MKNENISKVLIRKVFDLSKEKNIDLDVAFAQHKNLRGTFSDDTYEETRKYVHENYTELCEMRRTDPDFKNLIIEK